MAETKIMTLGRSVLIRVAARLWRLVVLWFKVVVFLFLVLVILWLASFVLEWSGEQLPTSLHVGLLALTGLLMMWGLYWLSTEDLRKKALPIITWFFGDLAGLLILSALLLVTAARLLASFTLLLYENDLVELESNIAGEPVNEGWLFIFYVWHFLEVVPFLSIPDVTNLREPVTYSGTLVGVLVLLFQGVAVLILIPTVRSFFRKDPGAEGSAASARRERVSGG